MAGIISHSEIDKAVNSVLRVNDTLKLFTIPHAVTTILTESSVRPSVQLSLRNPLVDFPRLTEDVIGQILYRCDEIIKSSPNSTQAINQILEAKRTPRTPLAKLSEILNSMGISWDVGMANSTPIVYINPERYYTLHWKVKLRDFITRLNNGEDYPETIYERASMLTPSYNVSHFAYRAQVFRPAVFNLFEKSGLDVVSELDGLVSIVGAIQQNVSSFQVEYLPQIEFMGIIKSALADMRVTIDQLYLLEAHGHFSPGFLLLRKLLADLGMVLFFWSFAEEYPRIAKDIGDQRMNEDRKFKEFEKGIERWNKEFPSEWFRVYHDENLPIIRRLSAKTLTETLKSNNVGLRVSSISTLEGIYKNGKLTEFLKNRLKRNEKQKIHNQGLDINDTPIVDSIDILINYDMLVFDAIKSGLKFASSRDEKNKNPKAHRAYVEYHKLSDGVHSSMLVDFPPYSSTLEYLGFFHHLRIVHQIFSDVTSKLELIPSKMY